MVGKRKLEDVVERTANDDSQRKQYSKPKISNWGTIADLTKTGLTHAGGDAKEGSVASQGV